MNTRKYKYLEAFKNTVVSVVSSRFIVKLFVYLSHEKRPHNLFKLRTISYLLYSVYDDEVQILFLSYFGVNHPVLHFSISLYFNFQDVCTS